MSDSYLEAGCLYVVATPIGCLDDLSERARRILLGVDLIAAEDTRHSGALIRHLGGKTPMVSLHDHNERERVPSIIERLKGDASVALISDAGTPLISDPGYRLVSAAHDADIKVSPVPGPSAVTAALSASGLPTDRFSFEGFLPAKAGQRKDRLRSLALTSGTLVFFDTGKRIRSSMEDFAEVFGPDRRLCLAREISKRFETIRRGSVAGLTAWLESDPDQLRGEFVLVVEGAAEQAEEANIATERLIAALRNELSPSRLAK
ncbi:MAG: 16S rRNA (cytidine(1402)-2'-O)-methyltransferase, partial [Gammaproteobacteria bacterium]